MLTCPSKSVKLPATGVKLHSSLPPPSPPSLVRRIFHRAFIAIVVSSLFLSAQHPSWQKPARKLHVPAMRRRVLRIMWLRLTAPPAPRAARCVRARIANDLPPRVSVTRRLTRSDLDYERQWLVNRRKMKLRSGPCVSREIDKNINPLSVIRFTIDKKRSRATRGSALTNATAS